MEPTPNSQVTSSTTEITIKPPTSAFIKFIRIFLLVLIIIGIGLLCTINLWVPKLVSAILAQEIPVPALEIVATTSQASENSSVAIPHEDDPCAGKCDVTLTEGGVYKAANNAYTIQFADATTTRTNYVMQLTITTGKNSVSTTTIPDQVISIPSAEGNLNIKVCALGETNWPLGSTQMLWISDLMVTHGNVTPVCPSSMG